VKTIATLCAIAAACFTMSAQEKPQDKFQRAEHFEKKITKNLQADYLLFLPKGYENKSKKQWPLLLVLHGAGERGTNVWRADIHGPSKYIATHPDFPFILVSPICPGGDEHWSNETLSALLDAVIKKYNADPDRIYLTGLSMGGYGAWNLAIAYPEKFAAVIPICGGGETIQVHLARLGYLKPETKAALKNLPIWAFHGSKDSAVPVTESEHIVAAFKALGNQNVKLTIYPGVEHNSWEQTYNNPEIYDWLLSHKRSPK
jgi:predicted peptidase